MRRDSTGLSELAKAGFADLSGTRAALAEAAELSGLLAAGLKGIEEGYDLPAEAEDNVWTLSDSERRALGYNPLPASLDHAVQIMEESELVAETLGEQVFNYVLLNKRQEWRDYRAQVTPFELRSNLEML